jgi:outer membrane lipoprotein-sorting protein
MKKSLFAFALAVLLLTGCGRKAAKEAEAKALEAEVEKIETVTAQIDSTITDIEEAAVKLDTLLNKL